MVTLSLKVWYSHPFSSFACLSYFFCEFSSGDYTSSLNEKEEETFLCNLIMKELESLPGVFIWLYALKSDSSF